MPVAVVHTLTPGVYGVLSPIPRAVGTSLVERIIERMDVTATVTFGSAAYLVIVTIQTKSQTIILNC